MLSAFFTKKKGFTLIEVLVVVLIVGILTSIALPNYRRSVERARVAEVHTLLRAIADSCERLAWENGKSSCGVAVSDGVAKFNKLDITIKGTYASTTYPNDTLITENFRYQMVSSGVVFARAIKGAYTGAEIALLPIGQFACANGETGESTKACTVWAANTWNAL